MEIKLYLTSANGIDMNIDVDTVVKDFVWVSDYIPLVGDAVSLDIDDLDGFSDIGWLDGRVTHREFIAGTNKVHLTLKIERNILRRLDQAVVDKGRKIAASLKR